MNLCTSKIMTSKEIFWILPQSIAKDAKNVGAFKWNLI